MVVDIRTLMLYSENVLLDPEQFKIMRVARGFSLTQLAESIGMSVQYVYDMENGRRTLARNPSLINKIARTLECPTRMICKCKELE